VGSGVKLSAAGWKGVAVALAFGSTVTRLKVWKEAGGSAVGAQAVKISVQRVMYIALFRIT
jgi:hypothetical protein